MVSPILRDLGRDLEITLDYTPLSGGPLNEATVSLFWNMEGPTDFSEQRSHHGQLPTGRRQSVAVTLPEEDGRGVRRLRIDPTALPGLTQVFGITVRPK
jgi:hypothetical protein